MTNRVTVIDYGIGNLFSVCRALEHCGAEVEVASDPQLIVCASKLLLPGVGAFGEGMGRLNRMGLSVAIRDFAARGGHLLGVCLGMQLLLDSSEEFGKGEGLGLIPGRVIHIPGRAVDGTTNKIPHIGWSDLVQPMSGADWDATLLETTPVNTAMYFVHSFMAVPDDDSYRLADCLYGGIHVPAIIGRNNIWGAQFHPEKSGEAGLNIVRRFLALQ